MVLDYLKQYVLSCGAQYVGEVSCSVLIKEEINKKAEEIGIALVRAVEKREGFPEQTQAINSHRKYFAQIIEARKEEWPEKYQYYKDKGWL